MTQEKKADQQTFIFIGRSGCGKGTQAKLLMEALREKTGREIMYIQTGGELREFIKGDSHTQKLCKEIMDVGGLQPEFLAVYMWVNVFVNKFHGTENVVFDGCPRKPHEAGVLDSVFDFYHIPRPTVIHLDVSEKWSMDRLISRHREDDKGDEIKKRLSWYETDVAPTIEYYVKNKAYKYVKINGERSVAEIQKEIFDAAGLN